MHEDYQDSSSVVYSSFLACKKDAHVVTSKENAFQYLRSEND
jgi:hypothetical protein